MEKERTRQPAPCFHFCGEPGSGPGRLCELLERHGLCFTDLCHWFTSCFVGKTSRTDALSPPIGFFSAFSCGKRTSRTDAPEPTKGVVGWCISAFRQESSRASLKGTLRAGKGEIWIHSASSRSTGRLKTRRHRVRKHIASPPAAPRRSCWAACRAGRESAQVKSGVQASSDSGARGSTLDSSTST